MFRALSSVLLLLYLLVPGLLSAESDPPPGALRTALDRYVAQPDPHYSYKLVNTVEGPGYTAYILDVTSQVWRKPEEVDRTVWKHWLTILKPAKVDTTTAMLFIGGGENGGPAPGKVDDMIAQIALGTNSVVASLGQVPNQPLHFPDEPMEKYKERGREEDAMITYTWDKYIKTADEGWPARLPMTKSAVRAMDTITLFLASEEGGGIPIDTFYVAGGSKRGWTTWTTAAVDPRVIGISPIVIDMLNLEKSFEHHYRAYGHWSEAVGNYEEMGLMDYMGDERYHNLLKIVEPYEYRSRYWMPKFLINSSGDEFFLPDSSQFYWDDLPGVKYLRYVPNAPHSLGGSDAVESLAAFYHAILYNDPLPKYDWEILGDGAIRVETEDKPTEVKLWKATNPETRDFREKVVGKIWESETLEPWQEGIYIGKVETPEKGWTAFFVELTYPSGAQVPFKFTSEVHVVPETLPFEYPPEEKK